MITAFFCSTACELSLNYQIPSVSGGRLHLPRSRAAKNSGITVWPTASKFLALAVSDCLRRYSRSAFLLVGGFHPCAVYVGLGLLKSAPFLRSCRSKLKARNVEERGPGTQRERVFTTSRFQEVQMSSLVGQVAGVQQIKPAQCYLHSPLAKTLNKI